MEATGLRVTPVVVYAAGVAALIAWVLRDRAEFLPSGDVIRRSMSVSGHHGAGGGFVAPAAVAGDPLASYAGLAAFALHALMIAVAVAGFGMRRWSRRSTVDGGGVLVRLVFAGSVAVVAALVTAGMAGRAARHGDLVHRDAGRLDHRAPVLVRSRDRVLGRLRCAVRDSEKG